LREENIYLIKTDANGNDLWTKEIQVRDYSEGKSVQQTSDGGYIITGNSRWSTSLSDMVLIKTDASGNVIWTKTFGGSSRYDDGRCVQQTTDGGYIIAGRTDTYGQLTDVYLVKTDASGNLEWQQVNNGSGHEDGNYVEQTSDGGFIVVGYTLRIGTSSDDVYLIKTDATGNFQWEQIFGGTSYGEDDRGYAVQQISGGGYIITGRTRSYGAVGNDIWLVKTDANGNTLWTKTFGGSASDLAFFVQQTNDGGFIITGHTNSFGAGGYDVWLIKTDANGNTLWTKTFGGSADDLAFSVQQTNDGGYIVAGHTISFGAGGYDVWLIKTTPDPSGVDEVSISNKVAITPNPFTTSTTLSYELKQPEKVILTIYEYMGKQVYNTEENQPQGKQQFMWNAEGYANGVYYYRLQAGEQVANGKLVKVK